MRLFFHPTLPTIKHPQRKAFIPPCTSIHLHLCDPRDKKTCVCSTRLTTALDLALTFWELLLPHAPIYDADGSKAAAGQPSFSPAQWELWKRFLTSASHLRVISKDTWTQFLSFLREIDPHFETHDFEAAWPSVMDEFVTWVQEQRKLGAL